MKDYTSKRQMNEIIDRMVERIKELPAGAKTNTYQVFEQLYPDQMDSIDENVFFDMQEELFHALEKQKLYLDMSEHDGMAEGYPFYLDFTVYHKKAGKKCPKCGNHDTAKILYGLPCFSEELQSDLENHRIALGGCCIKGNDPRYHCFSCDTDFD